MRHVWRGIVVVVSAAILTVTVTAAFGAIDWRQLMRRISLPPQDDGAIEGRVLMDTFFFGLIIAVALFWLCTLLS
jgi:hypothetical protein